jgi:hypothetical protein
MALATVAVALVAEFAMTTLNQASAAPADKVLVCHRSQSPRENHHTISVSGNALQVHLAHGDHRGECRFPPV